VGLTPEFSFQFVFANMASSSSHTINGIPLSTLLEWYKIRDTFIDVSGFSETVLLAISMASSCQHPDARWLTEACAGKDLKTSEDAKSVFSALGQNDARALCFSWCCDDAVQNEDLTALRRSAELGYAFAQALMARETEGVKERMKFAQQAAAQGERDGFLWLGVCLWAAEKNLDKAKENFLLAIELGSCFAMDRLGYIFDERNLQRWQWWGRAAIRGNWGSFFFNFVKEVELFNSGSGSAAVMFAIGDALHEHVNEEAGTVFESSINFDSCIGPAKQAIAFYLSQINATKAAMHAWTQVGIQFNIVKDVRKLIAKLIWDSREEALFKT
jgi:hypothetical protein